MVSKFSHTRPQLTKMKTPQIFSGFTTDYNMHTVGYGDLNANSLDKKRLLQLMHK